MHQIGDALHCLVSFHRTVANRVFVVEIHQDQQNSCLDIQKITEGIHQGKSMESMPSISNYQFSGLATCMERSLRNWWVSHACSPCLLCTLPSLHQDKIIYFWFHGHCPILIHELVIIHYIFEISWRSWPRRVMWLPGCLVYRTRHSLLRPILSSIVQCIFRHTGQSTKEIIFKAF